MGLDMWFKEDIRNVLFSINAANADIVNYATDPQIMAYRRGYLAALMATAAAFGINLIGSVQDGDPPFYPMQILPTPRLTNEQ